MDELLHPVFDEEAIQAAQVVAKGLPASPGAATGQIVYLADDAAEGFVLRAMDVAGAKEAFTDTELPFLVFRNVENSRVGVVYELDNGDLGYMESNSDQP